MLSPGAATSPLNWKIHPLVIVRNIVVLCTIQNTTRTHTHTHSGCLFEYKFLCGKMSTTTSITFCSSSMIYENENILVEFSIKLFDSYLFIYTISPSHGHSSRRISTQICGMYAGYCGLRRFSYNRAKFVSHHAFATTKFTSCIAHCIAHVDCCVRGRERVYCADSIAACLREHRPPLP